MVGPNWMDDREVGSWPYPVWVAVASPMTVFGWFVHTVLDA